MAPATGRATTLFANAGIAGSLPAGALAGVSMQHGGYAVTLLLCGMTAVAAAIAFVVATRPQRRSSPEESLSPELSLTR
jgi:MFS transporter, SET family, sugar efflux transporter